MSLAEPGPCGVLLEVAYDGAAFRGWARQRGVRTVEETVQGAVRSMDPRASAVRGASRTDAGVHAEGQLVAFDTSASIAARGWVLGLNGHLPDDVAVRAARLVPPGFSPRFAADGKRYRYRLLVDPVRDPHWRARAWRVDHLDAAVLAKEGARAVGTHDFAAFRTATDRRPATTRTITRVAVEPAPSGTTARVVEVVVEGNAFLHNMVRILVGTMVDVARGRLAEGAVDRALESRDRRAAGTTAPAHGLSLESVAWSVPAGTGERWPP